MPSKTAIGTPFGLASDRPICGVTAPTSTAALTRPVPWRSWAMTR